MAVEVLHAYAKPNPQLDASLDRLAEPAELWIPDSGPVGEPRLNGDPSPDDAPPVPPRPLKRRLTVEQRKAIVLAYNHGVPQKALAIQYGLSDRSVKRLIAEARKSGLPLRTRAI
ncbi:sigma factor-like helix-turn-helix DNA-binding protein [Glycomyces harbinensis]|uniref:sigma factor-like helix-turn-helix DNA-binding protein n=1 Tax=Glycomyces harbinensis TaxID=58114 RepID=UPI000B86C0AE